MFGVPDPLYVQARRSLLDATDALADELDWDPMVAKEDGAGGAGSAGLARATHCVT